FFSSRRRHTRSKRDWSSDVCSSDLLYFMTYTLTQFENVDKIQLRINGHTQEEMPVNGTPIKEGYTRANGINLKESDTLDLVDSRSEERRVGKEWRSGGATDEEKCNE